MSQSDRVAFIIGSAEVKNLKEACLRNLDEYLERLEVDKASSVLIEVTRYFPEKAERLVPLATVEELVKAAHQEGALAMAHYYHGEYASDEFKVDHGERALRPEHLEWARQALTNAKAILEAKG